MDEISFKDKQEIFSRLEKVASQANLSAEERARYEEEWKRYNDYFNTLESAHKLGHMEGQEEGFEKGRVEGRAEGRAEGEATEKLRTATRLKQLGVDPMVIAQATGLSIEEIEKL